MEYEPVAPGLVSEIEQLDEELIAVRAQRDEKETIIEAMTANAVTVNDNLRTAETTIEDLGSDLDRATSALDRDDDDDPEDDPNGPTGGGSRDGPSPHLTSAPVSTLRQAIVDRAEALTREDEALDEQNGRHVERSTMRPEDSTPAKAATLAGPAKARLATDISEIDRLLEGGVPRGRLSEIAGAATPSATPRDKFPPGIGDCRLDPSVIGSLISATDQHNTMYAKGDSRLGYDEGQGIYFDRTKTTDEIGEDGEPLYEECQPEDIVAELERQLEDVVTDAGV
ncbi:hypothetical protein LCGC14_2900090, partial [marine sediment metagenome]